MSKKLDRALYGPTWMEVILGAVISVALGIVLASAYLIFKPVTQVKELPKEPAAGMVYYIEGSHDGSKARRVATKEKILLRGGSISVIEDELNIAIIPANTPPAPGKKPAPEAESTDFLTPGTPNFRIHDGLLQISVPVHAKYALVGLDASFIVQAEGTFTKDGDTFVYEPTTVHLGSCPVQRLPMIEGFVMRKFVNAQRVPADLMTAWNKLAEVTIDGATLKLAMPKP